jgi:hypothetical protein
MWIVCWHVVIAVLRQTGWDLSVDSSAANPNTQRATPDSDAAGGSPPSLPAPVLSGSSANVTLAAATAAESTSTATTSIQF